MTVSASGNSALWNRCHEPAETPSGAVPHVGAYLLPTGSASRMVQSMMTTPLSGSSSTTWTFEEQEIDDQDAACFEDE